MKQSLIAQAKRLNATFIRIEPTGEVDTEELIRLGFRRVAHVQPENTSVVDLTGSIDDIIAAMSSNNRNLYRTHTQKGLSVHASKDPRNTKVLIKLLHGVSQRTGLRNFPDNYIQKQADILIGNGSATLFNVTFEDQPLVAALVYDSTDTRYYAHAAASYSHRNLNAGNVLVAEMIIDAKKKGLKHFDLYGIWPHAEKGTSQAGITRFKRSFGGEDVHYAGTWELPVKPYQYALYSLVSKAAKLLC